MMTSSHNDYYALLKLLEGNEDAFPTQLAEKFPHIVEKIITLWSKPFMIRPFFQDLMMPERMSRSGFAPEICSEIFVLSNLYDKLNPMPEGPMDGFTRSGRK